MADAPVYQKPTFDARLKFYEELFSLMNQSRILATMGELRGWYRSLCLVVNKVKPFIEPKDRDDLTVLVDTIRPKIERLYFGRFSTGTAKDHFNSIVDHELMLLDEKIHHAARKLMLPLQELDTGEFDVERFMRESDLSS